MEMDRAFQIPVHGAHGLPACRGRTGNKDGSNIVVPGKVSNVRDETSDRLTDHLSSEAFGIPHSSAPLCGNPSCRIFGS